MVSGLRLTAHGRCACEHECSASIKLHALCGVVWEGVRRSGAPQQEQDLRAKASARAYRIQSIELQKNKLLRQLDAVEKEHEMLQIPIPQGTRLVPSDASATTAAPVGNACVLDVSAGTSTKPPPSECPLCNKVVICERSGELLDPRLHYIDTRNHTKRFIACHGAFNANGDFAKVQAAPEAAMASLLECPRNVMSSVTRRQAAAEKWQARMENTRAQGPVMKEQKRPTKTIMPPGVRIGNGGAWRRTGGRYSTRQIRSVPIRTSCWLQ